MTAGIYNFTIEKGATFSRTVTWYTDQSRVTAVNLTSYTAAMKIRNRSTDAVVATSTSDITLTLGGSAGTIGILISATATAAMTATGKDACYYDLELTLSGVTTRLLMGFVTVSEEATR